MEKSILGITLICTKIIRYVLYFCDVVIAVGIVLTSVFRYRIIEMLESENIVISDNGAISFPLIVYACINAFIILVCVTVSLGKFQKIIENLKKEEYFSKQNSDYCKDILSTIAILTTCQISARLLFNYMQITDVSAIFDLSLGDYLVNIVFALIAFCAALLFNKGRLLQEDSESII
ncbi:MAG: DUF2975 domain-containing protein [Peptostreptococcaceae bacterium]|nr:DUF2975 domain-containing protein [Peptostreptococcaceae bacterium]